MGKKLYRSKSMLIFSFMLSLPALSSNTFIYNSKCGEMKLCILNDNNEQFNFIDREVAFVVKFH